MNNERPFENIDPVPNIGVGYFEKEEYLKIIDRQEKQIQSLAWKIMALQSSIEILEKWKRPQGEWIIDGHHIRCNRCNEYICNTDREDNKIPDSFCPNCGAAMKVNKND